VFYVEQDLLERLTDCISDNFFFFMNAFDSYKILREMAWKVASANWIVPSFASQCPFFHFRQSEVTCSQKAAFALIFFFSSAEIKKN